MNAILIWFADNITSPLEDAVPSLLAGRSSVALGQHQSGLARAATLEQLREKLETETPERKMLRLAEEQQRRLHHALQQNLLAMTSHIPMNLRLTAPPRGQCVCVCVCVLECVTDVFVFSRAADEKRDLAVSISSSGAAGISVSVEVNGVMYSGQWGPYIDDITAKRWPVVSSVSLLQELCLHRSRQPPVCLLVPQRRPLDPLGRLPSLAPPPAKAPPPLPPLRGGAQRKRPPAAPRNFCCQLITY